MTTGDRVWHLAATLDELVTEPAKAVEVDGVLVGVFAIDDAVYAIENVCTHQFALLTEGYVEGVEVECPLHQARFHIPTGKCLGPPASEDVAHFPVKIQDGRVYVAVDASRMWGPSEGEDR